MRWFAIAGLVVGLLGLTACPEVEAVHYEVDRKAKTVSVVYEGIRSDDPAKVDEDYATVAEHWDDADEEGFEVTKAELYEADGKLNGRLEGIFDDMGHVGFYKHDRRSPTFFCKESGSTIVSTNGTKLEAIPGCIVWERKVNELKVSLRFDLDEDSVSLLPQHRAARSGSGSDDSSSE